MLTGAIQEALIALLCYDDTVRGARMAASLVSPKTYDVFYSDIATAACDYLTRYGVAPQEHTQDLFASIRARNPANGEIFDKIYESLQITREGINRDYVLKQASTFARKQSLKSGVAEALNLLENEDEASLDSAQAVLAVAGKQSYDLFDPGTFLNDTARSMKFLDNIGQSFPTGIAELDERDLGPARGQYWAIMALYGKGKTWALASLAKRAVIANLKVAVVTCEMSEASWCQRLFQSMFAIRKRDTLVVRPQFKLDDTGLLTDIRVRQVRDTPWMGQTDIRPLLRRRISKFSRYTSNRLVVKQFPTGALTVPQLGGWLDSLENACNFIPDLLVLDYVNLMKIDPKFQVEDTNRTHKDLRGLAISRNMGVATATQSNRSGEGAKKLGGSNVSADFSIMGTADVFLTYNQTEAEHEQGLARLFVQKGRGDRDRYTILISQAYDIGQFCMDSCMMTSEKGYWGLVKGEEDDDDK